MYVCMYVCTVHVCMYVCMYVCVSVLNTFSEWIVAEPAMNNLAIKANGGFITDDIHRSSVCMYVCTVCMYVCMYDCMTVCMYV